MKFNGILKLQSINFLSDIEVSLWLLLLRTCKRNSSREAPNQNC